MLLPQLWAGSGLAQMTPGQGLMIDRAIALISRLSSLCCLLPSALAVFLSNIPGVEIATGATRSRYRKNDWRNFGPLLADPRTLFLGAAAQFGIFATLLGPWR